MNSIEMQRRKYRKLAYWELVERWIHTRAAGIHFISDAERDDYRATRAIQRPADSVIPNVVELPSGSPQWQGPGDLHEPRLAYFGRYDVWTKGLDLAVSMLDALRGYGIQGQLHLYGENGDSPPKVKQIARAFPEVALFHHGYVDAPEKFGEMAAHDLYVQYSRFESFGMALAEAMAVGVPSLVSERSALAPRLVRAGAAIEIPMEPVAAAKVVAGVLARPELLREVGQHGRAWVRSECSAAAVVARMDDFYERALDA
jgi:glycosyltransferase involved in cell wall biosynthesis